MAGISEAISKGLNTRVENAVAGKNAKGSLLGLGGIEDVLVVAGMAGITQIWNNSRSPSSRNTWRAGEIGIGLVVSSGAQANSTLQRVIAGTVTGAGLGFFSGGSGSTTGVRVRIR